MPEWEKLSSFLTLLIPKLPSPTSDETPVDVLETIDMDSYRAEVEAAMEIAPADAEKDQAAPNRPGPQAPIPACPCARLRSNLARLKSLIARSMWQTRIGRSVPTRDRNMA